MEHEGKPLAADETDTQHHRNPAVASVHVRVVVTWLVIFPLAAVGMTALSYLVPTWPPVLKALVLTLIVVPTAVYLGVPRLLLRYNRIQSKRILRAASMGRE